MNDTEATLDPPVDSGCLHPRVRFILVLIFTLAGVATTIYFEDLRVPPQKTRLAVGATALWSAGEAALSAQVTPAQRGAGLTGHVTFTDSETGRVLCRAQRADDHGWFACSFNTAALQSGWHRYIATYSGDSSHTTSSASGSFGVFDSPAN